MAGRTPKPTALLRLQGTLRPDRHAGRAREPKPAKGLPEAPAWLLPEARAEWGRVCLAYGAAGILTPLDRGMLATYCTMWGRFVASEAAEPYQSVPASYIATMAGIASRLGLDPAGRTRLQAPDAGQALDAESGWDRLQRPGRAN